ncbi:hypothetical protein [Clostridium polynesiense]|uniref:hypothetical protein n=1 Tax=Clostridium polynesiense TaxID=1325933 RepID=UPI00058D35DF|nr:hypothetical protein [Clostridium polynesiense]
MRYKKNILILVILIIGAVGIWIYVKNNNSSDMGGESASGGTIYNKSVTITADKKFKYSKLKLSLKNMESKEELHYKVTDPNNKVILQGTVKGGGEFKSQEIIGPWIKGDWHIEFNKNDNIIYDFNYSLKFTNK